MKKKMMLAIAAVLLTSVVLLLAFLIFLKHETNSDISITSPIEYADYLRAEKIYKSVTDSDTSDSGVLEMAADSVIKRIVEIEKRDAIVFFSAVGCTGCDEQYPYFKKVAKEYKGRYMFLMNKCQMGNQKFQKERFLYIDVFPKTIVFKDGKECKRFSNPIEMEDWLKEKGEQY